jgi:hypothetical protein
MDVVWNLIAEGVIAPGKSISPSMQNLPWFHLTAYGRTVVASDEYEPHDPVGYLARVDSKVTDVDSTVRSYLAESLSTFLHGDLVASTVMLGVAAERVFDLVCESLVLALLDGKERAELEKRIKARSIKPRLDWVHEKLRKIEQNSPRPAGFPESATLMVIAIYDLMRAQRNDLGHPRTNPPRQSREDVYVHLQIFPGYYATAESLRACLATSSV